MRSAIWFCRRLPARLAAAWSVLESAGVLLAAALLQGLAPYWLDQACSGRWAWPAAAAICLLLWPLASEQLPGSVSCLQFVALLLALAAAMRTVGACLRVPRAHAAGGALDHYAIVTLAGAHPRRRAWSAHGYVLIHAVSAPIQSTLPCLLGDGLRQVW
jgi:hypothetical protein